MEVGIKGAKEDVRHVERPERPIVENGRELVAVPLAPGGRVEADSADMTPKVPGNLARRGRVSWQLLDGGAPEDAQKDEWAPERGTWGTRAREGLGARARDLGYPG